MSFATAFRRGLLVLVLSLSSPVLAAGFTCSGPAGSGSADAPEELHEVVVTAEQAATRPADLRAWLARLVGRFTYDGYVDLCGQGNPEDRRAVTGNAECVQYRSGTNVHCTVHARWPETTGEDGQPVLGGVSNLAPAFISYGLEARHRSGSGGGEAAFRSALRTGVAVAPPRTGYWGLMFTQVDNRGVVEWGSGALTGDTFTSREPCVGMHGVCQKTTRITAGHEGDEISMVVAIAIGPRQVLRQVFRLQREPDGRNHEQSGDPSR